MCLEIVGGAVLGHETVYGTGLVNAGIGRGVKWTNTWDVIDDIGKWVEIWGWDYIIWRFDATKVVGSVAKSEVGNSSCT